MFNQIDIAKWSRREHFAFFQGRRNPCLSVTSRLNARRVVEYRANCKTNRLSSLLYRAVMKAVNGIPEFKMRIIDLRPVEFEYVDAAFTYVPKSSEHKLHSNCIAAWDEDAKRFMDNVENAMRLSEVNPTLCPDGGASQQLVYLTMLRDFDFTSITNPWGDPWVDTVPRIAMGMISKDSHEFSVSVEALHSFVDGRHVAAFLQAFQHEMDAVFTWAA